MIYGIGVDLIEIERMAQAITRTGQRLIERLYTDAEQAYWQPATSPARLLCGTFRCQGSTPQSLWDGVAPGHALARYRSVAR